MAITENYILMCDDFRVENNGKFIIVGMYITDMTVPSLPFPLPTLTFFCSLESDRPGTFRFSFTLRHEESGRNIAQGMGQAPVNDHRQPIIMPVKIGGLQISAPGLYTFSLEFDGQAPIVRPFNVVLVVPGAIMPGAPQNQR
jgi:hypothetical protein